MTRDEIIESALQCGIWIPLASGPEREQRLTEREDLRPGSARLPLDHLQRVAHQEFRGARRNNGLHQRPPVGANRNPQKKTCARTQCVL